MQDTDKILLSELRHSFSADTLEIYSKDTEQFLDFANKLIGEITTKDVAEYIAELDRRYSLNTKARKISAVCSVFNALAENGVCEDPFIGVKVEKTFKVKTRGMSREEAEAFIREVENSRNTANSEHAEYRASRDLCIMTLLYYVGLKLSRILSLNIDNIRSDCIVSNGVVTKIYAEKAVSALSKYMDMRMKKDTKERALFLNNNNKRLTIHGFEFSFVSYAEKIGLIEYSPKDLHYAYKNNLGIKNRCLSEMSITMPITN